MTVTRPFTARKLKVMAVTEALTPEEKWERHNRGFRFEPPEGPPETWSEEDYERLFDRVIVKNAGQWECQKCTTPLRSLRKARRHVERKHSEQLIGQAVAKQGDSDD